MLTGMGMDRQRYPSYGENERRANQFPENTRHPEGHAAEIDEEDRMRDEREKQSFLRHGIVIEKINEVPIQDTLAALLDLAYDSNNEFKVEALLVLTTTAEEKPKEFSDAFTNLLNFDDPSKFDHTLELLDKYSDIQSLVLFSEEQNKSGFWGPDILHATDPKQYAKVTASSRKLFTTLQRAVKEQKGNYVLNIFARSMLAEMETPQASSKEGFLLGTEGYPMPNVSTGNADTSKEDEPLKVADIVIPSELTTMSEETANQYLSDYKFLTSDSIRPTLENDFGTSFSNLSGRERFYFLKFLREKDMRSAATLRTFSNRFGASGLRTLLVTANDERLREDVFQFAKSMDKKLVDRLFAGYAKLVEGIDQMEGYLRDEFGDKSTAAINEIIELRLKRAREVLFLASGEAKFSPQSFSSFIDFVEEYAEKNIFLNTCKLLRQKGLLSLEDIKDTSLETSVGDHIAAHDAEEILHIQQSRYDKKYPDELQVELGASLQDALKSPYSNFYLYRKNGEILTYVRFDQLAASNDGEKKHMASFMTNPKFEGGALGQAMLELALEKELEKGAVYAECDPSLVPFYEKFGFRLLRSYKDDYGVETCDIVLEPASESEREAA